MSNNPKRSVKKNPFPRGVQKEEHIKVSSPETMQKLAGDADRNLRKISEMLDVQVSHTTDGVSISGLDTDVELVADLVNQLVEIITQGGKIFEDDVVSSIKVLSKNRKAKIDELVTGRLNIPGGKVSIVPKTFNQKLFLEAEHRNDIIFGVGPAGTGKTYLAIAASLSALLNKKIKKVVLCRPAVEAGEKLGFLPGDMAEKVNPYLRPLYDALFDMVGSEKIEELFEREMLEVAPLAFMRGRSLRNSYVILDEAQNTTTTQMKMFLTRLGFSSKFFVTGDVSQIDLMRGQKSGLVEAVEKLKSVEGISVVKFDESDVMRHPLVGRILEAYGT